MRMKAVDGEGAKLSNYKMMLQIIAKSKTCYVTVKTNGDGVFMLHDDYRGAKIAPSAAKTGATVWTKARDGGSLVIDISKPKEKAPN